MAGWMRRRWIWTAVLAVLSVMLLVPVFQVMHGGAGAPKAVNGVLDLSSWDVEGKGPLHLDGEWLLKPETGGSLSPAVPIAVPGAWNGNYLKPGPLPAQATADYRLVIRLRESSEPRPALYTLRVPPFLAAYELRANGYRIGGAGIVEKSREGTVPEYRSGVYSFFTDKPVIELIVRTTNYYHPKGGIRESIEFGMSKDVLKHRTMASSFDSMLIGSLMIMGFYHVILYAVRRKDHTMLYFGLYCILLSVRMSLLGEVMMKELWPQLSWLPMIKIEYITASGGIMLFTLFLSSIFPEERRNLWNKVILYAGAAMTILIAGAPSQFFTWLLGPLQLYAMIGIIHVLSHVLRAYVRERSGSLLLFIACWVYAAAIVNDMLFAQGFILTTDRMSGLGLLVFIFFHAILLAIRISQSFSNEERLSQQLAAMNSGLSDKVRERTAKLVEANRSLKAKNEELYLLENSRSRMLSNISHDLGTPMTTIQCYLEAIMDGLVTEEQERERYVGVIHSKVLSMNRLIDDLFQLSQLEARQTEFKLQPVRSDRLIRLLFERFELDVQDAGVSYQLNMMNGEKNEDTDQTGFHEVRVDVERLHQVYSNLITNALKFTPAGGFITVSMHDDGKRMLCSITDSGIGIEPDDAPYIFDRFYTADKSRSGARGKGLGLAISKEIIASHEGEIWLEWTKLGEGTSIAFAIPIRPVKVARNT